MFDQVSASVDETLHTIVNSATDLDSFLQEFKDAVGEDLTYDRRYGKDSLFLFIRGMGITYWPSTEPVLVKVIQFLDEKYPHV